MVEEEKIEELEEETQEEKKKKVKVWGDPFVEIE